jgi:hypothetical protein
MVGENFPPFVLEFFSSFLLLKELFDLSRKRIYLIQVAGVMKSEGRFERM